MKKLIILIMMLGSQALAEPQKEIWQDMPDYELCSMLIGSLEAIKKVGWGRDDITKKCRKYLKDFEKAQDEPIKFKGDESTYPATFYKVPDNQSPEKYCAGLGGFPVNNPKVYGVIYEGLYCLVD